MIESQIVLYTHHFGHESFYSMGDILIKGGEIDILFNHESLIIHEW